MQILSLRLEDFKSYADSLIEFTPGTNAIVGHNGAGKSSILEAIGFALFDYAPSGINQSDLVREGARSATITVTFVSSADERQYQVIRRCGASSLYQVYDPDLDQKICENKVDVLAFLREHFGVEPTANLSDLFANAVGVPQGTFTSAFLQTPSNRKSIFDPLLRVEEYKTAFDRLREPLRLLDQRMNDVDVRISGLTARLERLPALESEVDVLCSAVTDGETQLAQTEADLAQIAMQRKALETLRDQLQQLQTDVKQAQQQVESWQRQRQAAQARVGEAAKAQEIVEANRAGHETYQAAQEQQKALDAEARQRQNLRDRLSEQDKKLSLAQAERERQQAALRQIEEAETAIEELADAVAEQERLEDALQDARSRAERLADLRQRAERRRRAAQEADERLQVLRSRLQEAEQVRSTLADARRRAERLQESLVEAREAQGRCQAEAERLKEQIAVLEESDGVLCPVCEQPLDEEHRQSLLARNQTQLADLRQEWKQVRERIKQIEDDLAAVRTAIDEQEERLQRLPRAEEEQTLVVQRDEAQQELAQIEAQVKEFAGAASRVEALGQELDALGDPRRKRDLAAQTVQNKAGVTADLQALDEQIAEAEAEIAEMREQLSAFADLDQRIADVAAQIETNQAADDAFRRHQQLAESLPQRQQEAIEAERGLAAAEVLLREKEEAHACLTAQFDEAHYQQLSEEEQTLRSRYGALSGQLREQRKRLSDLQAEIEQLRLRQEELTRAEEQRAYLQTQHALLSHLRNVLRDAGPYVTKALVRQIGFQASQIFGEIMQDFSRRLEWSEDYGIVLEVDGRDRQFAQLSGGEQMSAALSVRLALLREMSDIDIAFFDEPTTNLDEARRESLARQILDIKGFRQIFVISHDDTFEQATENLIRIRKENGVSHQVDSSRTLG